MADKRNGKEKYPHLFEATRIGNLRLKNRIIAAPTSPSCITTEGHFTYEMLAYLEERAKGGAAVVTYGEAIVHSATGKSHNKQLQLDSFGVKQLLREASRLIHNNGAYANIQLSHGGMYGGLESVGGTDGRCSEAYGPSEFDMPQGHVKEMPKELIDEIIDSYGKGAKLCKDCGFDMVQVHAAHGWLFSQFLSPYYNKRTDEFGGSLENRARFFVKAVEAVREAVGPAFPIEARISGDDLSDTGIGMDECIEVAKMLDGKVDLINVSCGNHEDPALFCRTHPSAFFKRGVNVYLAAEIKKHVKTPVACVGSLNDPAQMEEIIAGGESDYVEIGRALVADPYIPEKALRDEAEDITPCLRCYECFGETVQCENIKCAVNPKIGLQLFSRNGFAPAAEKKRVLVAGGGPAGMQAAITLAGRGHEVTLVEKADKLGGNLHPAGAAYFKRDIAKFCQVLINRVHKAGVRVVLNTEVTPAYVREAAPDVLFVAIGSEETLPPIPGIRGENVVMAIDAELHPEKLGKKVVIMGGGLVGSEAAVAFHAEGRECAIIEMKDEVAGDVNMLYRGGLMPEIEKAAAIYTNTVVKEITDSGVTVERAGEQFAIEADSVVCALGFHSPWDRVDALCDEVVESYIVGDCNQVAKIFEAVNDAFYAAMRV